MTAEVLDNSVSAGLAANLNGDKQGLPDWYTHFGSEDFARSAIPVFSRHVQAVYPKGPLTILGLGSGRAFYERQISRNLQQEGWKPRLIVSDLQEESLRGIPEESFPVIKLLADATNLPEIPSVDAGTLVLSRAVEHYLPEDGLERLVSQAGRVLAPGELYVAQITSGEPYAVGALSASLETIAGKKVHYLSVDEYKQRAEDVSQKNGSPLFAEIAVGHADTQKDRGSLAQARRYLNPRFLALHAAEAGEDIGKYRREVASLTSLRDTLGVRIQSDGDRDSALKHFDDAIQSTSAFGFFRETYIAGVNDYLRRQHIDPRGGLELPGVRLHGGVDAITDAEVDITYPVVVWQRAK